MSTKQKDVKQDDVQVVSEKKALKFKVDALVTSKALSEFGLHRDVIRAILVDDEYTIEDAKNAIQKYIDSFNH